MARWEIGTRQRLAAAALDLYVDHGFEATTVAEIAARAGVTERTFFRHFTDKREVLFDGQRQLELAFVEGVRDAPLDAHPLEVVGSALQASADFFSAERRPWSRRRQAVLDVNPGLKERELLKLASLASAVAVALRARGLDDLTAGLAAESAVVVFGQAFLRWIAEGEQRSLAEVEREVLRSFAGLAAPAAPVAPTGPGRAGRS